MVTRRVERIAMLALVSEAPTSRVVGAADCNKVAWPGAIGCPGGAVCPGAVGWPGVVDWVRAVGCWYGRAELICP
jgi:hypothetical protein